MKISTIKFQLTVSIYVIILIEDHQDLQNVYEEISKKNGMLEKKYRNTRVRLEKEIIFLNIENWKTIKRKTNDFTYR